MSSVVWRKKRKKKLATVIVGLFSLKENAPTKKKTVIVGYISHKMPNENKLVFHMHKFSSDSLRWDILMHSEW